MVAVKRIASKDGAVSAMHALRPSENSFQTASRFVGFVCLKTERFLFFGFTVASAAVGFIFAAAYVQPFQ